MDRKILMLRLVLALGFGVLATGCLRKTEFKCTMSSECVAPGSVCEANGYCSFVDSSCPSGHRFGDLSGDVAGQCVGGAGSDAGVDSADAFTGNCKASYAPLPGVTGHVYRSITTLDVWATQKTACAADGANAYLAVPNDATELGGIVTLGADLRIWVGIDDQANEGTYVTTRGGTIPANDPMWAPSEPNNMPIIGAGQADCVVALMASTRLADDNCTRTAIAVCECEP